LLFYVLAAGCGDVVEDFPTFITAGVATVRFSEPVTASTGGEPTISRVEAGGAAVPCRASGDLRGSEELYFACDHLAAGGSLRASVPEGLQSTKSGAVVPTAEQIIPAERLPNAGCATYRYDPDLTR
jgi:hypothetical protein